MMHLLRSLFVGYFIAIVFGSIAVSYGYGPVSVVLGVWFSGSVLSVAIAATVTPFAHEDQDMVPIPAAAEDRMRGAVHQGLTAREMARWDADLAAERFEADLALDASAAEAEADETGRKAG